jgi:hypothetical protein
MDFPRESLELMKTLADADPAAPTACSQWTVHDLVAHLGDATPSPTRRSDSLDKDESSAQRPVPDDERLGVLLR